VSVKLLKEALLGEVGTKVSALGFKARSRSQSFLRRTAFGHEALHLSFFGEHEGAFCTTQDVAIRFSDVEEITMELEELMSRAEKKTTATLGCELGNLVKGKQMVWYDIGSQAQVRRAAEEMFAVFLKFGIPYFERYADREQAFAVLSNDGPEGGLHSPSLVSRAKRAVALALLLRGETAAKELAAEKLRRVQAADSLQLPQFREFIEWLEANNWRARSAQ
jgi:hypothetical protein